MELAVDHQTVSTEFYTGPMTMEGNLLPSIVPERDLWSAVLLLLLKDCERVRRDIIHNQKVMDRQDISDNTRAIAWEDYCRAIYDRRDLIYYSKSPDFTSVCDQAGIHEESLRILIADVVYNRRNFREAQLKRGFTRTKK